MRGFLFTVALVSTALVILSLTFFVMQSGLREKSDITSIALFDRVKDNALWIENGFRDIVSSAGINLTVDGYNVSIIEQLPNPNELNFTANVDDWKNFSNSYSSISVSLSVQEIKDYLPLTLRPSPVTYTHPNGLGGDKIMVENASNVANYSLDLDIDISEPISLTWTSLDTDPAELSFRIRVHNSTDTIEDVKFLDSQETSTLSIAMNSGTISIDVGHTSDFRRVVLTNEDDLNATLTTNITLSTIKNPIITFPSDVLSLYTDMINTSTMRPVRIA